VTVPSAVPPRLVTRSAISSMCSRTTSEILSNNSCRASEMRSFDIPVRLLDLALQVDGVGQAVVRMTITLRRVFSDKSIFVLYIEHFLSSADYGGRPFCTG